MVRLFFGLILGAAAGALIAGALGGALGALCGAGLALAWVSLRRNRPTIPANTPVRRESHRVMCIPRGEVANCVLLRDERTGRFLDVETCSLEPEGAPPRCAKRCFDMLKFEAPTAS